MKVKICGQTSLEDASLSLNLGADFIGVIFDLKSSKRSLDYKKALPIFEAFREKTFLLLANHELDEILIENIKDFNPYAIQLAGDEDNRYILKLRSAIKGQKSLIFKSIHTPPTSMKMDDQILSSYKEVMARFMKSDLDGFVIDTKIKDSYGGTAVTNDWNLASEIAKTVNKPVFLAGGINPDNIEDAIKVEGICAVDIATGAEYDIGKKDKLKLLKILTFVKNRSG